MLLNVDGSDFKELFLVDIGFVFFIFCIRFQLFVLALLIDYEIILLARFRKALANVNRLVTAPAKVLLAVVAVVGLGGIPRDSVGGVALGAPNALTLGESNPLAGDVLVNVLVLVSSRAYYAELSLANQTVGHPPNLIYEEVVILSLAALRRLIQFHNSLDILGVVLLGKVK